MQGYLAHRPRVNTITSYIKTFVFKNLILLKYTNDAIT